MTPPRALIGREGFRPRVILGPPGTGKTSRLLALLEEELKRGTPPGQIAFVTFTRAARSEARRRVRRLPGLRAKDLPWLRTLHSAAYRLLDLRPDRVMGAEHWDELAERYGYRFSRLEAPAVDPDEDLVPWPRETPDDVYRHAAELAQNGRMPPEAALARSTYPGASAVAFARFRERLAVYKRERELLGFADMLEEAVDYPPPVQVAFVDEAQDLSPLQVEVVESWFEGCPRVYVAGDDDQTVYTFQGADPTWLKGLAERTTPEVLSRSYRVPLAVHELAQRIIRRNRERVSKEYRAKDVPGRIQFLDRARALDAIDGSVETFVLARNRIYLRPFAKGLVERRVPFLVEGPGARSPLSDRRLVHAVQTALDLAFGSPAGLTPASVHAVLAYVPKGPLVPEEARRRIWAITERTEVLVVDDLREDLGLGPLLDALAEGKPLEVLGRIEREERKYLGALIETHGGLPDPRVILTSIHASKGREAPMVVVVPDMTRATFREYEAGQAGFEAENRLFYTAVTRSLDRLVIVDSRGRRHFEFPRVESLGGRR